MKENTITLKEYDSFVADTAIFPKDYGIAYPILGLVGEAGELANKYKKVIRDDENQLSDAKREDMTSELGDVLWYCSALAQGLGKSLDEVVLANIKKLTSRRERGTLQGSGDNR